MDLWYKELRKKSIQGHNTEKSPGLGLGKISKFWYWKISRDAELGEREKRMKMCGSLSYVKDANRSSESHVCPVFP